MTKSPKQPHKNVNRRISNEFPLIFSHIPYISRNLRATNVSELYVLRMMEIKMNFVTERLTFTISHFHPCPRIKRGHTSSIMDAELNFFIILTIYTMKFYFISFYYIFLWSSLSCVRYWLLVFQAINIVQSTQKKSRGRTRGFLFISNELETQNINFWCGFLIPSPKLTRNQVKKILIESSLLVVNNFRRLKRKN